MLSLIELILKTAEFYHRGQFRWDKKTPYIEHPKIVAKESVVYAKSNHPKFTHVDLEIVECIGLGHDLIEDTSLTLEMLRNLLEKHFSDFTWQINQIIEGIGAITKDPTGNESYLDYILRVKNNPYARIAKICDITHNSSDLKRGSMKDKYSLAKYILEN